MHPVAVSRVDDAAKAIAAHALDPELAFIAGGTDLIGLMKDRAVFPERLLDINGLPNMARIEALPGGGVRIGALAKMSDVAADHEVRWRFAVIAEALLFSASGQLRNMASIGGNIMQQTRSAYFRDETDGRCNKRHPCSGRAALHGLNRNHAIFGWSDVLCGDQPVRSCGRACSYLRARDRAGESGRTTNYFHRLPGGAPERDNVLDRGDLIVAIEVPASVEARASHYLKIRDRASYEFALVSAAPRSPQTADASARRGLRAAAKRQPGGPLLLLAIVGGRYLRRGHARNL